MAEFKNKQGAFLKPNIESGIAKSLLLIATLSSLVVAPWAINAFNSIKLIIFSGSLAIFLLYVMMKKLDVFSLVKSDRVLLTVSLVVLFGFTLTGAFNSSSLRQTMIGTWGRNNGILMYFGLFVFLFLGARFGSQYLMTTFISWLSGLGTILSIYGLIQSSGQDFLDFGASSTNNALYLTFGNINFSSGFLAMSLTASFACLFLEFSSKKSNSRIKSWIIISTLLQIYTLYKAESTQGFIAVSLAMTVFILLHFAKRPSLKLFNFMIYSVVFTSLVLIFAGIFGLGPSSLLLSSGQRSLQDRAYHWMAAWSMFRENIFFGVGIDSFGDWYRAYRLPEAVAFRGTTSGFTNNAHNIYFQFAATGGLAYALPLIILSGFIVVRGLILNCKSSHKSIQSIAVFAIWIAYQAQALVSIDQIGLASWGWLAGGICLSSLRLDARLKNDVQVVTSKRIDRKRQHLNEGLVLDSTLSRGNPILLIAASFLVVPLLLWAIPGHLNELRIKQQIIRLGALMESEELRNTALTSDTARSLYVNASLSKDPDIRLIAVSELLKSGFISEGLDVALTTTEDFPRNWDAWDALGFIYENTDREELAIEARKKQFELDPLNPSLKQIVESQ